MEEVEKYLKKLGYEENDIKEIVNSYPLRGCYPETVLNNIKRNYDFLISIGYSQEDIIKMTKTLPSIYGYSIENMKQKIEALKELEYSQEEIIKMTKALPTIYGYSIENIKQKVEFYDSIKLHSLAIIAPKALMQSTALSYARYMFYKEKGINIDETNYNKLFISQKKFEKQYGVEKRELLERYNYRDYLENLDKRQGTKSTQELGQETIKEQGNTALLDNIEGKQKVQQKILSDKTKETK